MIDVQPVATHRDMSRFIGYTYQRNRADPHWVPPLRTAERARLTPRTNPFFAHADVDLLLAWQEGRVVGRIAAIDDRLHNLVHGDNVAMFGFFEAEHEAAAQALLEFVETWARARGRRHVRGPLNPSMNESAGLLVDGFDTDPMVLMPHNPPEYARYIERAGYRKVKDLFAWLYELNQGIGSTIEKLAARFRERHSVTVRPLDRHNFEREAERLREIYCSAWQSNWGFVPPTAAEFRRIATELRPIFDSRGSVVAEVNGRVVACALALPDINQALKGTAGRLFPFGLVRLLGRRRIIDQMRLLLVGVMAEYRTPGLYPLLLFELHKQLRDSAYKRIELSWVLEDNRDVNQPALQVGARRYKTYRIYQKALL